MIAGIVSLDQALSVDSCFVKELKEIMCSCSNGLELKEVSGKNFSFFKINTYALNCYSGIIGDDEKIISLITGEPILTRDGIENDHKVLVESLLKNNFNNFSGVRGVFTLALFSNMERNILSLCSDKLGIRPMYYWSNGILVVFSTLLKIIERFSVVPKIINAETLSEVVVFGTPLGNRTKYNNIYLLREAEIISFELDRKKSVSYWNWDSLPKKSVSMHDAALEAYDIFKEAVQLRLRNDETVSAYLSGGMDSRAIVTLLAELGSKAYLLNFSPSDSQDKAFAAEFAKRIGFPFLATPRTRNVAMGFRRHLADLASQFVKKNTADISRPRAIWSGDGGSVSVGCVYLDETIVDLMRQNLEGKAIERFIENNKLFLPVRSFKKLYASKLNQFVYKSVFEEINRINCKDKADEFFLFLMFNDQRRHLNDFYEDIDQHNIEYQLPFFDSKFLEYIFSLPIDYRLNHIFYTKWFEVFPPVVISVPWQTYPGHVPCPFPIDTDLLYQWGVDNLNFFEKLYQNYSIGISGIKMAIQSKNIGPVSNLKLFCASFLQLLGLKDYNYLVKAARIYKDGIDISLIEKNIKK